MNGESKQESKKKKKEKKKKIINPPNKQTNRKHKPAGKPWGVRDRLTTRVIPGSMRYAQYKHTHTHIHTHSRTHAHTHACTQNH